MNSMNGSAAFILLYFIIISFIGTVVCIYDKSAAVKRRRRVSEKSLFGLCWLGASAAMYITMLIIRHKTLHKSFMIGIPIIIIIQTALIILIHKVF